MNTFVEPREGGHGRDPSFQDWKAVSRPKRMQAVFEISARSGCGSSRIQLESSALQKEHRVPQHADRNPVVTRPQRSFDDPLNLDIERDTIPRCLP